MLGGFPMSESTSCAGMASLWKIGEPFIVHWGAGVSEQL
jgi:hypothetical protein